MIALTGATGGLGGRVAARLAKRGIEQRLVVRDPSRAPDLVGTEPVQVSDYGAGDEMRAALEGCGTLLLVSFEEARNRVEQHSSAIDAAVAAGVERIVYTSFLGAAPDSAFLLARDHFHTEEHLRASGARFTILRDSVYLDFVPYFVGEDGAIRGPAGDGRVAPVARDDIADVAVAVLTEDGHDGQVYELTGPEALTYEEIAERLSDFTGGTVTFVDETIEEAWASRRPSGAPDWIIEGWISTYLAVAGGELETVTDAVEQLAGHPPMGLGEFLREHPESYARFA